MNKITRLVAVLLVLGWLTGCAYKSPTSPSVVTPPPVIEATPLAVALRAEVSSLQVDTSTTLNVEAAVPDGTVAIFQSTGGSVAPQSAKTTNGRAQAVFQAGPTAIRALVTVTVNGRNASSAIDVTGSLAPPPSPVPPDDTDRGPLSVTLTANDVQLGSMTVFSASVRNGRQSRYTWDYGDGQRFDGGGSNTTAHQYAALGSYTARVSVTDADDRSAGASVTTTVSAVPTPPPPPIPTPFYTVTLSASPSSVVVGSASTLTATVTPVNGATSSASYAWDCTSNGTVDFTTTVNFQSCSYPSAGAITSSVTVSGTGAIPGSATTIVTVAPAAPLLVNITPSSLTPAVGTPVTFTGTVTTSGTPPGSLQWEWDFEGDGTFELIATGVTPNVQTFSGYGSVGVKTVRVRITDPATGRTATGSRSVTVVP